MYARHLFQSFIHSERRKVSARKNMRAKTPKSRVGDQVASRVPDNEATYLIFDLHFIAESEAW